MHIVVYSISTTDIMIAFYILHDTYEYFAATRF